MVGTDGCLQWLTYHVGVPSATLEQHAAWLRKCMFDVGMAVSLKRSGKPCRLPNREIESQVEIVDRHPESWKPTLLIPTEPRRRYRIGTSKSNLALLGREAFCSNLNLARGSTWPSAPPPPTTMDQVSYSVTTSGRAICRSDLAAMESASFSLPAFSPEGVRRSLRLFASEVS